jgi:FkbM family methyltransferase
MELEGLEPELARRVLMTVSCRDTDRLPKVDGAGAVFSRDGRQLQRMHNGLLIEEGCYEGAWMTEIIRRLDGNHEPQEEVVFHEVLERLAADTAEPTMIELGSYWAYYSMWFCQRTSPRRRIVDMEPDPGNLETGRRNFALNDLESTFVHGIIGHAPGEQMPFKIESTGEMIEVRQHDLRTLMEVGDMARIDLLLVDIQGYELPLLQQSRDLIAAGLVRFMIISTHHYLISGDALTHQKVLDLVKAMGGHVIAEHSVGESYSGDGLVAVSFDDREVGFSVEVTHARYKDSLFGELEPVVASLMTHANRVDSALAQRDDARRALSDATRRLRAMEGSHSWRLTAPVRSVSSRIRGKR